MIDFAFRRLPFHPVAPVLSISTVLTGVSLAVATAGPGRDARTEPARWLDALGENTLPAWWSTALLITVALAFAVTGAVARAGAVAGAGAWFTAAGMVGAFSLAELSGVHRRLAGIGRLVLGEEALTRNWFTTAAVLLPVLAGVLIVLGARVGAPSGRLLVGGGVVFLVSAVAGAFLAALLGGPAEPVAVGVAHLGGLGGDVGAALMMAAAGRALVLVRDGDGLAVRHRAAVPGGAAVPMRPTAAWWWLGGGRAWR